jgi:hypothetical protein
MHLLEAQVHGNEWSYSFNQHIVHRITLPTGVSADTIFLIQSPLGAGKWVCREEKNK